MAVDYGTDLGCFDDLAPDAGEVSDLDVVAQDAYHALIEARGSNPDNPDGGADVGSFYQQKNTPGFVASIPGRCATELLKDPRINSVTGTAVVADGGQSIRCDLRATTGVGPFRLVFDLTPDGVKRLTEDT